MRASEVSGIKVCRTGVRRPGSFSLDKVKAPNGRMFLWTNHRPNNEALEENSDLSAIKDKKISITPLKADLTEDEIISILDSKISNEY